MIKKAWIFVTLITLLAMFVGTVNVMAGSVDPVALRRTPDRTPRFDPTKLSTPDKPGGEGGQPGPGGGNDKQPSGGNSHGNDQKNYQGSIAAVDSGSLTLTLKDGSSLAFVLNADTRIKIPSLGHDAAVADLKVGDGATVRAAKDDSGALVASMVEVKPAKPVLEHFAGTVTDYQPGVSITIQDKNGASSTFLITPDTKINTGPKNDGAQLGVGAQVTIVALRDPAGGTPTAKEIAVFPQKRPEKPLNYQGSIAAVDASSLTLTLKDGSSLAFVLNADTKIKIPGLGHTATAADLKVGDGATVRAAKDDTGALVASMIEVKPAKPVLEHFAGTVTDYQPGVSITIQDKNGASSTFLITADTKINSGPKNDGGQLSVGAQVTIVALRDPAGGTPTAKEIAVFPQKRPEKPLNYQGTIAAVDAGSLTLTLKDGSSLVFVLNADTKIKIPGLGHDATVADLKVGERVIVRATKDETGSLVASMILLIPGKPEKIHHVGIVTDYQPGVSITIQDKDGDLFTFLITPQTKILPPDLAGTLGVGSRVTIIAPRDVAHGTLTAAGIVVHPAVSGGTGTPTSTPTATATATPTP